LSYVFELAALARSVFAVGFPGRTVAEAPLEELRAFGPGAVVLFARNVGTPEELTALVAALRGLADPAPLIAVDQEGGRVARLGPPLVPALPSAMALGALDDPALCERLGLRLGRDLARAGISVDFAPVADLALEPANTVIGTRAFGGAPETVARLAGAFARGLERGGVAATLKHFPGHGATSADSHRALPRITADEALLRSRDLVPFALPLAAGGASLVMAAHVVVEALDPARPASLSPLVLGDLLRGELRFSGTIVTDCLEMEAIAGGIGSVAGALEALQAGADLLVMSHHRERAAAAAEGIAQAVAAGTLPAARLEAAAARLAALRRRFAIPAPADEPLDPDEPAQAARQALTILRGELRLRPDRPVTVVSFEGSVFDGAGGGRDGAPSLSAALRARRWKSEHLRVALDPAPDDVAELAALVAAQGDRNLALVVRRAHLHALQYGAVARLLAVRPDALLISAAEPYDALLWPDARNVACTYGDDALAFAACADVLSGRFPAAGALPVPVDALG
jgi:beta-N-acetylhexosaminidase